MLSLTVLARRALGAPAYDQYDLPQHQSVEGYPQSSRGYQGPPVVPVILPGGFIADTEEVARAKESHFSAYARAASNNKYNPAEERYSQPKYNAAAAPQYSQVQQPQPQRQQDYNVPQHRYTGPVVTRAYTPAPTRNPVYQSQPTYSPQQRYQGPPVIPVILPNGYIAETADVEAARQQHFELVAQAQAAVARAQERDSKRYGYTGTHGSQREDDGSQYEDPEENYNQVYQPAPVVNSYNAPQRASGRPLYQGPSAVPVVLPSGHIADTAEVAAAKISHLQQLLDAAQKSLPQQRYQSAR